MNKLLNIISVSLYITCGSVSVAQDQQNVMLADLAIPLMDGTVENLEAALLFDSPDGRIINAEANGAVAAGEVYQYYQAVLPSLGWNVSQDLSSGMACENNSTFCMMAVREEENLTLNIEVNNSTSRITYALSPN